MNTELKLPDVGEGLTEAEIATWHVEAGDHVEVNDVLVEVETAKAVVELPSPAAGTIQAIHVVPGQTVPVGTVLVTIGDEALVKEPDTAPATPVDGDDGLGANDEDKPLVLVGPGPSEPAASKRRLGQRTAVTTAEPKHTRPRAKPPVRRLAAELGIDLASLQADPESVITRDDVLASTSRATDSDEREIRTPIRGVRKATAEAMVRSAFTAPHVTEWLTVDVTATMKLLARLKADRAWTGVRINPLLLVARALLLAIRRFPAINATWDEDAQEIVQYTYVNLGIAAATPRGLIVPNIKDADRLDLAGLAQALGDLVETARAQKTPPAAMAGGTITITNIGALGVDAGTPILNPGESAILAFGAIREMPWVVDGQIEPRQVTQLAMSFDHRLVDGELGSYVLAEVGALLSDPARAIRYA